MKLLFRCRCRGWVIWAGLFFGVLPIVYAGVISMAYARSALDYDEYLHLVNFDFHLGWPGLNIPRIWGTHPFFWIEHSRGWVFWKRFFEFLFFNILGWTFMLLLLDVLMEKTLEFKKSWRGRSGH